MAKKPINKRKVAVGLVVAAMLLVPIGVGWKSIEPLIFVPAKGLFKRLPVTYANLSPIRIRHRSLKRIKVRVIEKGKGSGQNIRVTFKDNSPIKIIRKDSSNRRLEDVEGLPRVHVQRTFRRGVQPQRPGE